MLRLRRASRRRWSGKHLSVWFAVVSAGGKLEWTKRVSSLRHHVTFSDVDFEDKTDACANGTEPTNGEVRGKVPQATYDGLS
ncbi:hypothetical protein [Sorangium sp. So ce1153]|uniref:hypothetical protein n=1 Tax=Sorangium sp. So ce1153 TaxID=3133333 RepID=UPI003F61BA3A